MHLLEDPSWFLAACDVFTEQLTFIRTSPSKLKNAAFHDGRTLLSVSAKQETISFAHAISWHREYAGPVRDNLIIAHMSFCGSTLLARLMGQHYRVASYREPNALVEISDALAMRPPEKQNTQDLARILPVIFSQYQKFPHTQHGAFVKPSNWTNPILEKLVAHAPRTKIIFLELKCRSFLIANLRGGRDRVAYSLNLLNHISRSYLDYGKIIAHIGRTKPDTQQQMLRLLVACFSAQQEIFARLRSQLSDDQFVNFDKSELMNFPEASLMSAAQFFGFRSSNAPLSLEADLNRNAKEDKFLAYNPDQEIAENAEIEKQFSNEISLAMEWYARTYKRDFWTLSKAEFG